MENTNNTEKKEKKHLSLGTFTIPTKVWIGFSNITLVLCAIALVSCIVNDALDTVGNNATAITLGIVAPIVFLCGILQIIAKRDLDKE